MRPPGKRTYGQYCGLARALDIVGDRWSLLVVRELLVGPLRFSQLERGLPGIAKNLLAERLKDLEQSGVVRRGPVPNDGRGVGYALSDWGEQLRPAVRDLAWWGGPLMHEVGSDCMRGPWYVVGLDAILAHRASPDRAIVYEVSLDMTGQDDENTRLVVEGVAGGSWNVDVGRAPHADFRVKGSPPAVLAAHAGVRAPRAIRFSAVRDQDALRAWKLAIRSPA